MDKEQARNAIRFGVSDKSPLENVGFRGIGIYSGFNICDSLEVYTKSRTDGNTYKLTFDFYGIRTKLLEEQERRSTGLPPALHLERLLEQSVYMETLGAEDFRRFGTTVIVSGLLPTAYGQVNDWDQVVDYLRNVVPLPFNPDFRYGKTKEGIWSPASANPLPRKQGDPRKLKNLKARERWRLYKEKGLCPRCGKEPPTSGRTSCTGCLQKIRQYKAQQKSKRTAQAEQTEKATNIGSAQASVNGTGQL